MVGADLNRVWNDYSEFFHPSVKAAMDAIRQLDDQPVSFKSFLRSLIEACVKRGSFITIRIPTWSS